ncbi:MAG TPA: response regulator transcription factor [Gemmatimonadaceae bacterium]|nr:response regulator transcription factor [Gemmatimonadaceae bacterium]
MSPQMTNQLDAVGDGEDVVRVLLADDHAVVREGLKALINSQTDMTVVGEAADGLQAIEGARRLRPNVLVMDLSMPNLDGAEATRQVRQQFPEVRVLALTVHAERSYLRQLLAAGAAGYVLKRAAGDELVRAVRAVAAGGVYIDPSIASAVVEEFLDGEEAAEPDADALSEREGDVLRRIARGYTNKEIAAELQLSVKTVETYKARVAEKLGLRTRVDIVRWAAKQGWLSDSG